MVTVKRCAACGIEKDRSEFREHKGKRVKPGALHSYCRPCCAAQARAKKAANPTPKRAKPLGKTCRGCRTFKLYSEFFTNGYPNGRPAYRPLCKPCDLEAKRNVAEADRLARNERLRIRRQTDSEWRTYRNQVAATYYKNRTITDVDRERARLAQRRWRQANLDRARDTGRRQARARQAGRNPLAVEYVETILRFDPCCYCGNRATTIDHIDPLAGGGSNEWNNLAPACGRCNSSKRHRPLLMFLLARAA